MIAIAVQATENVDIVENDFAGVGPEALTPVEGHPVPEHVGPPPSKVGVKSIVPMAVVLSVLGAVIVLGISAGIFTWIYHYRGSFVPCYHFFLLIASEIAFQAVFLSPTFPELSNPSRALHFDSSS